MYSLAASLPVQGTVQRTRHMAKSIVLLMCTLATITLTSRILGNQSMIIPCHLCISSFTRHTAYSAHIPLYGRPADCQVCKLRFILWMVSCRNIGLQRHPKLHDSSTPAGSVLLTHILQEEKLLQRLHFPSNLASPWCWTVSFVIIRIAVEL